MYKNKNKQFFVDSVLEFNIVISLKKEQIK